MTTTGRDDKVINPVEASWFQEGCMYFFLFICCFVFSSHLFCRIFSIHLHSSFDWNSVLIWDACRFRIQFRIREQHHDSSIASYCCHYTVTPLLPLLLERKSNQQTTLLFQDSRPILDIIFFLPGVLSKPFLDGFLRRHSLESLCDTLRIWISSFARTSPLQLHLASLHFRYSTLDIL